MKQNYKSKPSHYVIIKLLCESYKSDDTDNFNKIVDLIFDEDKDYINETIKQILSEYPLKKEIPALSKFLFELQNRGIDLNSFDIHKEFLEVNYEGLVKHPTNPIKYEIIINKLMPLYVYNDQESKLKFKLVKLALEHGNAFFLKKALSTHAYSDREYKAQSEFVKLALDHCIDITNIDGLIIDLNFISQNLEILLNHPNSPINNESFLIKVLSTSPYNDREYKVQSEFVKLALDYGIDITKIDGLYLSLEFLSRNNDILLNHPTNPMNKKEFFSKAINSHPYNDKGYKIQSEFVKLALDHGIDITKIKDFYLSSEFLLRNQDLLLNHPTNPMNLKLFFENAFSYYSTTNEEAHKAEANFIKFALDHNFDFSSIDLNNKDIAFFYRHKELLLNHPTNPMKKETFFMHAISSSFGLSEAEREEGELIKAEFIKEAINSNVKLSDFERLHLNLKFIMENYDLLLNHSTNSLKPELFYNFVLSQITNNQEYFIKQVEFLKLALDSGINFANIAHVHLNLLAETMSLLVNHPTNPVNPSFILKYALNSHPISEGFDKNLQYRIVKEAIELGANVNYEFDTGMGMRGIINFVTDPDLLELMKSHGAICEIASRNYVQYLEQHPQIQEFMENPSSFYSKSDQNLYATGEYANKIPYIIHHVWLTHSLSPREMSDADIENVILTKNTFGENLSKWSHIIWTNNKSLIPKSVKILEENGIEVRDINDYKDQFSLYYTVTALAEKKLWGMASDALRYEIVAKFGGVYADLNYQFIRSIEGEMHKYDFVAQDFINYFFAARPNHPILNDLVKTCYEHYNTEPEYLSNFTEKHIFDQTALFSLLPFSVAIIENYNQDNNIDLVIGLSGSNTCSNYNSLEDYSYENYNFYYQMSNNHYCPTYWNVLGFGFINDSESNKLRVGHDGYKDAHLTWIEEDNNSSNQGYIDSSALPYYSDIA